MNCDHAGYPKLLPSNFLILLLILQCSDLIAVPNMNKHAGQVKTYTEMLYRLASEPTHF